MFRRMAISLLMALVLVSSRGPASAGQRAALAPLLERLAAYTSDFQTRFAYLIGAEDYTQLLRDSRGRSRTRQLASEVFFFGANEAIGGMTVRSVQRVDGRSVQDVADRINDALVMQGAERSVRLRTLADAGSRYNLGRLERNFNEPTLALLFGSRANQWRFSYSLDETEIAGDPPLLRIAYREVERPTIIRDGRTGENLPASGALWVDTAGTIWRTQLKIDRGDTLVDIRVDYRRDPGLDMLVPASMDEDYRYRDQDTKQLSFIKGHAAYSSYRRFETAARMIAP